MSDVLIYCVILRTFDDFTDSRCRVLDSAKSDASLLTNQIHEQRKIGQRDADLLSCTCTPHHIYLHYPIHRTAENSHTKRWHAAAQHPTLDPRTIPPPISRAAAHLPTRTRARGRVSCARRYSRRTSCRGTSTSSLALGCLLVGYLSCVVGGSSLFLFEKKRKNGGVGVISLGSRRRRNQNYRRRAE